MKSLPTKYVCKIYEKVTVIRVNVIHTGGTVSPDPFDLTLLGDSLENKQQQQKKTPHSFLGENSALVNLDNLVTVSKPPSIAPSPGKSSRASSINLQSPYKSF
jgi:hypothetical protein